MSKKIRLILFSLCFVLCLGVLTACGGEDVPEFPVNTVQETLETILRNSGRNYVVMEDYSCEPAEVNEDDMNGLRERFDSQVPYQKVDCTFTLKTREVDTVGYWSIVYAYYNGNWEALFNYAKDLQDWQYIPKDTVSPDTIISDLKTLDFEGFTKGYVGSSNTTIKVLNRDTKFNVNRDDVYIEITVKTDYASYIIEAELVYMFEDGAWALTESDVQEPQYWKINFISDKIPKTPEESYVLEQLTRSNYFLTYVANLDYMTSYTLTATKQLAGVTNIVYQYEFVTTYDNIGEITYTISIPYYWLDGEWTIGEWGIGSSDNDQGGIDITNIKVGEMLGTWEAENGDKIEFTETELPENAKYKSPYVVSGVYHKNNDGTIVDYNLKCEVNVPLRDNNWEANVILWEAANTSSVEFSIGNFSINTQDKTITTGDVKFTKTFDLLGVDVEGNPITSEVTTVPVGSDSSETQSSEVTEGDTPATENPSETPSEATSEAPAETPAESTEAPPEESSEKAGIDG